MTVPNGVKVTTLTVATGQPNNQLLIHLDKKSSLKPIFSQITNPVTTKTTIKLITAGPKILVVHFIQNIPEITSKVPSTAC